MNGSLNDATKNILQLTQVVFSHTKSKLSDPMQTLCGFLSDDWLSQPSMANHQVLMKILNACVPQLKPPFEASYISNDPHHVPLQMIQNTLSELKTGHSSEVGHYFDLACTWLNVLMAMDAAYKRTITWVDELAHAKEIAKTAEECAKSRGAKVVITILDRSAQMVLLHRMHGSLLISTDVAIEKAKSAILMQMPSGDIRSLVQPGAEFEGLQNTHPGICVLEGGFPMYAGARLIGAIGISGSSAELDKEIAITAVNKNYLKIKPEGCGDD